MTEHFPVGFFARPDFLDIVLNLGLRGKVLDILSALTDLAIDFSGKDEISPYTICYDLVS